MSIEITNQDYSQEDAAYNENVRRDLNDMIFDLNGPNEKEIELAMVELSEEMSPGKNLLEKDLPAFRDGLWLTLYVADLKNGTYFNGRDVPIYRDFSVARFIALDILRNIYWQTENNPDYAKFHNAAKENIEELQKDKSAIIRYKAKEAMRKEKQRD